MKEEILVKKLSRDENCPNCFKKILTEKTYNDLSTIIKEYKFCQYCGHEHLIENGKTKKEIKGFIY